MRALRSLAVIALRQASSTAWAPAGAAVAVAKHMEEKSSGRISTREKRVIVIVGSFLELWLCASWLYGPNMRISRQFRRLSRVLASKSDFLSFLRNHRRPREFLFLYAAHPAKPLSCTTILVAESQDLKPQMQTVLSCRAVMATSILTTFLET